jgi:hypothetical protein
LKFKKGEGIAFFFQQVATIKDNSSSATYQNIKSRFSDANIQTMISSRPVPSSITADVLKGLRDKRLVELFKKEFNGATPPKTDVLIEPWMKDTVGLNPTQSRTAYDNGWADPAQINNGKQTYNTDEVEVLKVVKSILDRVNQIINEGKSKTTFFDFDSWKKTVDTEINGLDDNKLPATKTKEKVLEALTNHRNTFKYKLNVEDNEVKGDGLTQQELTDAQEKLKEENRWKSKEYKPLTAAILNELLEDYIDKNAQKEDLDGWLRGLGGYTIDKEGKRNIKVAEVKEINGREEHTGKRIDIEISGAEVAAKEEKWSKEERLDLTGTYLLAFVHDLIGFNLDEYRPNNDGTYNKGVFAKLDAKGSEIDKEGKGVAPILTGGGKTTKDVCCIVDGGKTNVILVCPNEALASDALGHHKTWLQKNKCVTHGFNHGTYEVLKNDLVYYDDRSKATYNEKDKVWENVGKVGKKGLSILQAEEILGYIARSSVSLKSKKTNDDLLKEPKKDTLDKMPNANKDFSQKVAEIKTKLISKEETIIIFDEAHFSDAKYQEMQKQLVRNNYQVIVMSATFPKKSFSITTSHPRNVYLTNQFEPEYLEDGKTEKWSKQKTQIFLRTTEDEWTLTVTGKKDKQTLLSGLTAKQKKLLDDNDIAYVCFDRTNQAAVTGITEGMPDGSLFFANPDHEMGFSPHVHNVIITGQTQLVSLGKGRDAPWLYDTPETVSLPLASMVQQIGRVSRLFPGMAYLLTKDLRDVDASTGKLKEIPPAKDLSYKFVGAIMSGDLAELYKVGISNMGKYTPPTQKDKAKSEPNFLRASVALGYKPEEIMVGLRGQPVPNYPTYGNKPNVVDEELWNKHLGNPTPPQLDKEKAEQIVLLIVMNYLKIETDITKKIDISFDNPLIKDIWGKEVPKQGGKKDETEIVIEGEAAEKVRKALHTFIDKQRMELKGYKEDKNEYLGSEKDTYSKLVGLYRIVNSTSGAEIKVEMVEEKKGGKKKPTIKIAYPATVSGRALLELEKEIGVWRCHKCLYINNGYRFCEQCGIEFRLNRRFSLENQKIIISGLNVKVKVENEWESMSTSEIKEELENINEETINRSKAEPRDDCYFKVLDDKLIKSLLEFKKVYERVEKAVQELKRRGEEGWEDKISDYTGDITVDYLKSYGSGLKLPHLFSAKNYYLDLIPKTADNKLSDNEISALKPGEGDWRAKINSLVNEDKYSRLDIANLVAYGEDLLALIRERKNQEVYEAYVEQQPK